MQNDELELARHLFALTTELQEDSIEIAVAGQSPCLPSRLVIRYAHQLSTAARDIATLGEAAELVGRRLHAKGRGRRAKRG